VRAADAVEAIAVEIFRQCECSGQPVSMPLINRVLEQLRSHRPSCRCGLCEAAAKVKADRVYRTAQVWHRSVNATLNTLRRKGFTAARGGKGLRCSHRICAAIALVLHAVKICGWAYSRAN